MIQRYEVFVGLTLVILYISVIVWQMSRSISAGLVTLSALGSALLVAFNPEPTSSLPMLKLAIVSSRSFCIMLGLIFFILTWPKKWMEQLLTFIELLALADAALMLIFGFGFFNADSMDAAFIAIVYPMILFRDKNHWPMWARVIVYAFPLAILFTPRVGRTVFVIAAASLVPYVIIKKRSMVAGIVTGCIIMLACAIKGLPMTLGERTDAWLFYMTWWTQNLNPILGSGAGSFQWIGPELQIEVAKQTLKDVDPNTVLKFGNLYKWMHNDWLQILFEQGLLGFLSSLTLAFVCLKRSASRLWLFSTNIGLCVAMIPQFPLRFFVGQLLTVVLIRASLEEEL